MTRKTLFSALAGAAAVLALSACGSQATSGQSSTSAATAAPTASGAPTASAQHNAADVTFAQDMIPHHQQAIEMARLGTERAGSDQVKQLATRIQQEQAPEITQMQGFLSSWGVAANSGHGDMDGMTGMNGPGGMAAMPGMMSDQQMSQLGAATGAAFDRMFLQMMTEHHQGAITMAQAETAQGRNPEAKALALKIASAQQGEITEMAQLLKSA